MKDAALEELWATTPPSTETFSRSRITHLPAQARAYLSHTLAEGALLARAVRISMHGRIKLGEAWSPFHATQVISWARGFVWHAHTLVKGLPVSGSDVEIDGRGAMKWRILGIVPVMEASGPEITRSAIGRLHAEAMWLPGALLTEEVEWSDGRHGPAFTGRAHGEESHVELRTDADGAVGALSLLRWGDVGHPGTFGYEPFGGYASEEKTFSGVTIPTEYRIGWHFGTDRFDEGEFFRCTLDSVEYR